MWYQNHNSDRDLNSFDWHHHQVQPVPATAVAMTSSKHIADGAIEVTTSGDNKFVLETNAHSQNFITARYA